MLVLSRRVNEKIRIGDTVEVRILEMNGNTVRLGFVGPPEVSIHREEVFQRIQADAKSLVRA